MRGIFLTFEGPDGAGKTTQLSLLADALTAGGYEVVRTREPGGTRISDQIRAILLDPEHTEMTGAAEVLLYAAARAQHVREKILPALKEGKIVLCDRYIDASIAYQAYGLGIDPEIVRSVNAFASSGLRPDRTYLLDISVEAGMKRLVSRGGALAAQGLDRIESRQAAYHERVRRAFRQIAESEPDRVLVVNADQPAEQIHACILDDCSRLLEKLR